MLRDFASQIAITNEAIDSGKFYRDTIERYFLFDENEYAYFGEIYHKSDEVRRAREQLSRPNLTEEEERAIKAQIVSLDTWFYNQSDEMIKVFSKCLSIKTLGQSDSS